MLWPILMGTAAALMALHKSYSQGQEGGGSKPANDGDKGDKPKSQDELLAEAKEAGRLEAQAQAKAEKEQETRLRKKIRSELRYMGADGPREGVE